MAYIEGISLFDGKGLPTPVSGWNLYQQGINFNKRIKLEDTVRVNENFYIGK